MKELLEQIAREEFGIETFETQNTDSQDVHECAVWCIEAALKKSIHSR